MSEYVIGYIMLAIVFIGLFYATVYLHDIYFAVRLWGCSLIIALWIVIAVWLIWISEQGGTGR